jgi:hypothetical protein
VSTETQVESVISTTTIDIALLSACAHGRCDEKGNVYLKTIEGETLVGQWQIGGDGVDGGDPVAFFARRYLDLVTEVELTRTRLRESNITPPVAQSVLQRVQKSLQTPNFIGDTAGLKTRLALLEAEVVTALQEFQAQKAAQKKEVLAKREQLTTRAEGFANSKKWRDAQVGFSSIVEEWKKLPRVNKGVETKLWKRISTARSTFEKNRRTHFADRKKQSAEAQQVKKDLIKQAESLSTSTDWEKSSKALGVMMQKWKAAPRADRKTEEKLWQAFTAARDTFFAAKKAAHAKLEEAARANVPKAQELTQQIEAVRKIDDLRLARVTLKPLLDSFDQVGPLPKSEEKSLGRRVKEVQDELRSKAEAQRKRNDPEKSSRANSAVSQLKERMDEVRAQLSQAEARRDEALVTKLKSQLNSQQALLDAAEAVVKEFAG